MLATTNREEFALTDNDFAFLRGYVYRLTGIELEEHKRTMIYGRLSRRLRVHNMTSFQDYRRLLEGTQGQTEHQALINAVTTNVTGFFRESHHFDHLRRVALPQWQAEGKRRLRLWSSACSTGEEPYSIAMTLADAMPSGLSNGFNVLATDINTEVLRFASAGVYRAHHIGKVPDGLTERHFASVQDEAGPGFKIRESLRRTVEFRSLNLLNRWPISEKFDAIFCRNVLIYFDIATRTALLNRFADLLAPQGWLYLGHSESLTPEVNAYRTSGRTIYQKSTT